MKVLESIHLQLEGLRLVSKVLGELHLLEIHHELVLEEQLIEGVGIDGLLHQQALLVLPLAALKGSSCWCLGSHMV